MEPVPAALLTIAGFDPSSGAGMTADLKVFAAFGVYGLACPTAWTVQSTVGVQRVSAVDPALVRETLDCLSSDITIAGVKIGMLADAGVLGAVVAWLRGFRQQFPKAPVVLDPVLRSSSGRTLLAEEALPVLRHELLPLVSVVTPNLAEAELLSDVSNRLPRVGGGRGRRDSQPDGPDGGGGRDGRPSARRRSSRTQCPG